MNQIQRLPGEKSSSKSLSQREEFLMPMKHATKRRWLKRRWTLFTTNWIGDCLTFDGNYVARNLGCYLFLSCGSFVQVYYTQMHMEDLVLLFVLFAGHPPFRLHTNNKSEHNCPYSLYAFKRFHFGECLPLTEHLVRMGYVGIERSCFITVWRQ